MFLGCLGFFIETGYQLGYELGGEKSGGDCLSNFVAVDRGLLPFKALVYPNVSHILTHISPENNVQT